MARVADRLRGLADGELPPAEEAAILADVAEACLDAAGDALMRLAELHAEQPETREQIDAFVRRVLDPAAAIAHVRPMRRHRRRRRRP